MELKGSEVAEIVKTSQDEVMAVEMKVTHNVMCVLLVRCNQGAFGDEVVLVDHILLLAWSG